MYSYEDRIRAVEHYIKLGKRMRATIRQLGYPTKNSLKCWHREFERQLDLPSGYVRGKPKYSNQQKRLAVDHYLNFGQCIAATLKAIGYPCRETFSAWLNELAPGRQEKMTGRKSSISHNLETKQAAVAALCNRKTSARAIAQDLAVSRQVLYKWKDQLLGSEAPCSMKSSNKFDNKPLDKTQSGTISTTVTDKKATDDETSSAKLLSQIESLKQDIRRLQLEYDLLKKAKELLKKTVGVDLHILSNRDKMMLIDALKQTYALTELLLQLGLARSSYFYHLARLHIADKYAQVRNAMADIFQSNYGCYGYRRMRSALGRQKLWASEKVVRRLMKQESLVVTSLKRRRYGSYLGEISPAPDNLINRDFQAAHPNEKWLTDISEFQIPAGKVYLSPMIDCFDGMVVSWSIGTQPNGDLVNSMLDAATQEIAQSTHRPMVHSDRGAHYRWPGWMARMDEANLTRSMSRKGCSPDNAACEGFFGRLKTEMFYRRDWREMTIEGFKEALDCYIRWYNEKRIKLSLGALSPLEYRASLGITT
jgi:putative transposase